jgi:hypothetical protein
MRTFGSIWRSLEAREVLVVVIRVVCVDMATSDVLSNGSRTKIKQEIEGEEKKGHASVAFFFAFYAPPTASCLQSG